MLLTTFGAGLDDRLFERWTPVQKFRSSWHIAGENASCLTAGASVADFDQLSSNIDIVGMCGNLDGLVYSAWSVGGIALS